MKKTFFATAIVALASISVLSSCRGDEEKLSRQLDGSWSGAPEVLNLGNEPGVATMTPVYSFEPSDSTPRGGRVTLTAMISATMPVKAAYDAILLPFQVTASAVGTIQGSYRVIDDDEVAFNLDFPSLTVNINPDALTTADDALTDQTVSYFTSARDSIASTFEPVLHRALQTRYQAIRGIDDVKVKDGVLSYEIGDVKHYMHQDL